MNAEDARILILRDLDGMKRQLLAYPDEAMLWQDTLGISNPPGNIGLHVAGNLQAFIGAMLGGTGYVRQRDGEFSVRNLPLSAVIDELDAAIRAVDQTLRGIDPTVLDAPFPQRFGEMELSTGRFLAHLCGHLAYHLGQVDTHRRIRTAGSALPGMQSLSALDA